MTLKADDDNDDDDSNDSGMSTRFAPSVHGGEIVGVRCPRSSVKLKSKAVMKARTIKDAPRGEVRHCGPEQPRIQAFSIIHLLCTARFACKLC